MKETRIEVTDVGEGLAGVIDRVRNGEEFSITENGEVVAMLLPAEDPQRRRGLGMFRGEIWVSPDFNEPLSEEELRDWGY